MGAEKKIHDGITEIFLMGRVMHPHNEELVSMAEEFLLSDSHTMVINFKDATFIDSAELGALMLIRMRIIEKGRKLILAEPNGFVSNVFKNYQFDKVFTIEP